MEKYLGKEFYNHYKQFFMKHVEVTSNCWIWKSTIGKTGGYGIYSVRNKLSNKTKFYAHRFSYEAHVGAVPNGLILDHICRNRKCVNPDHLEPVTYRENLLRGETIPAQHAKKTHCPRGHAYSGDNLMVNNRNSRICRECKNSRRRVNHTT